MVYGRTPQQEEERDILDQIFESFGLGIVVEDNKLNVTPDHQPVVTAAAKNANEEKEEESSIVDDVDSSDEEDTVRINNIVTNEWCKKYKTEYFEYDSQKTQTVKKSRKKDILDNLFETVESTVCQSIADDDISVAEASKILSTPKTEWTNKDKDVLKGFIVHKLRDFDHHQRHGGGNSTCGSVSSQKSNSTSNSSKRGHRNRIGNVLLSVKGIPITTTSD